MEVKKIKLMIVDDHQLLIDGIKSLLITETNIEIVATANNGREAISILQNTKVDVVLIDIEMPILNGYETTEIIRKLFPEIKVICLTSHDEKSIVEKMINAGAKAYVLKNIDKEIILSAIEEVLKGNNFFSNEIELKMAFSDSIQFIPSFKKEAISDKSLSNLSIREIEILKNITNGMTNIEIAEKLSISPKTVDTHRSNLMQKLEIRNVVGLVKFAIKNSLID